MRQFRGEQLRENLWDQEGFRRSETGEKRKEHCGGMPFMNPGRPSTPRLDPEGQRLRVRGPGVLYLKEGDPQLVPARVGKGLDQGSRGSVCLGIPSI